MVTIDDDGAIRDDDDGLLLFGMQCASSMLVIFHGDG